MHAVQHLGTVCNVHKHHLLGQHWEDRLCRHQRSAGRSDRQGQSRKLYHEMALPRHPARQPEGHPDIGTPGRTGQDCHGGKRHLLEAGQGSLVEVHPRDARLRKDIRRLGLVSRSRLRLERSQCRTNETLGGTLASASHGGRIRATFSKSWYQYNIERRTIAIRNIGLMCLPSKRCSTNSLSTAKPTTNQPTASVKNTEAIVRTRMWNFTHDMTKKQIHASHRPRERGFIAEKDCTMSPDAPFGLNFYSACLRHDFGYHAFRGLCAPDHDTRKMVEEVFRWHLENECAEGNWTT